MNHICYIYIIEYRGIKNVGISLDARYQYDIKGKILTIQRNKHYIDGLWNEGVVSLSAIVGTNGAGKTTFLEAMLHMLADGSGEKEVPAIIVYEQNGQLFAYKPNNCDYNIIGAKTSQNNDRRNGIPNKDMFYFSSYFRPYKSLHNPGEGELAGVYNATDTWKIVNDLQNYSNIDTITKLQSLQLHLSALEVQDKTRIALMLVDTELRALLPEEILPRYIIISPNFAGYYNIQEKAQRYETYRALALALPDFERYKQGELMKFISAYFFNCAAEIGNDPKVILELHKEWKESLSGYHERAYDSLAKIANAHSDKETELNPILNAIEFLEHRCRYDNNTRVVYIDTTDADGESKIREMMHHYSNNIRFTVAHMYDISYARTTDGYTQLSSGETDMLKFFSRLYDAAYVKPITTANMYTPQLILVDEAENSYHPEWQRQFVSRLLKILHAIYVKNKIRYESKVDYSPKKPVKFQVVLTTHSPILLSDIPRMCINYLKREHGEVVVLNHRKETFGANVYDLYKDSFFMENGLVGEYAYEWINALREEIEHKESFSDDELEIITKKIEMIGDEVIQRYLWSLLEPKNKPSMVSYYKHKIEELGGE